MNNCNVFWKEDEHANWKAKTISAVGSTSFKADISSQEKMASNENMIKQIGDADEKTRIVKGRRVAKLFGR